MGLQSVMFSSFRAGINSDSDVYRRQNLTFIVGARAFARVNVSETNPADKRCRPNFVLMFARRLWRRPNIKATLVQQLVFAGNHSKMTAKVWVRWPQAFFTCEYCDQAVTNMDQSTWAGTTCRIPLITPPY